MPRKQVPLAFKPVTLEQARDLAIQEFGTAMDLQQDISRPTGWYCMDLGSLRISIQPDTCARTGCIVLAVSMEGMTGQLVQLYDPETLVVDDISGRYFARCQQQQLIEQWVLERGLDYCRETIYRLWNDKHRRHRRPRRATEVPASPPASNA